MIELWRYDVVLRHRRFECRQGELFCAVFRREKRDGVRNKTPGKVYGLRECRTQCVISPEANTGEGEGNDASKGAIFVVR